VTTISSTSPAEAEVGSACCATAGLLASSASHGAILDAGVLVVIDCPLSINFHRAVASPSAGARVIALSWRDPL
jgi:hypothetical protein